MIDKLANQIAQWNRRELKLTETESKVIEFGLGVFLDVCVKFLILFMISVLIGKEVEFATLFPNVQDPVIYTTDTPHFQFIKPNIDNLN